MSEHLDEAVDELKDAYRQGGLSRGELIRRAVALGLSGGAVASALAACGGDDAEEVAPAPEAPAPAEPSAGGTPFEGRTLTVQVWPGSYEEIYTTYVYEPWQTQTGAEIQSLTTTEFFDLPKLKQEADSGDPRIDMSVLLPGDVIRGASDGLFEPIPSDLANLANLRDAAKTLLPNGVAYLVYTYGYGKVNNIQELKGIDPTSWAELWDPKLEKSITVGASVPTYTIQSINLMLHGKLSPVEDDAWEKLHELSPNIHSLQQDPAQMQDLLSREEVAVAILFDGRIWTMQDAGVAVDYVLPSDGAYANFDYFSVVKGSKNADLAFDFLNFALSPEAQRDIGLNLHYGPTNQTVTFSEEEGQRVVWSDEQFSRLQFEDAEYVASKTDEWTERWNEWAASL